MPMPIFQSNPSGAMAVRARGRHAGKTVANAFACCAGRGWMRRLRSLRRLMPTLVRLVRRTRS